MATFTGEQTTVSAYLRLQTERINYGELIIQKTSEDGKKSGFTFKVTRDTDNWSVTVKTDDNGTAKISELPVFRGGTSTLIQYTVTEINTPSSYRQPKPQTITLTAKSSVTVQFENTLIRGTLEICKVDADGKTPLAGAVFEIMDSDKNVIATETTGKDGKITVSDLRSGYYREISAPQGYELDSTVYPFTVEKDRQIIQIVRKKYPERRFCFNPKNHTGRQNTKRRFFSAAILDRRWHGMVSDLRKKRSRSDLRRQLHVRGDFRRCAHNR